MIKNEEEKYDNLKKDHQREKNLLEQSILKFKEMFGKANKKKVNSQFEKLDKNISQIEPNIIKKSGKLIENKLYTQHYFNSDDIRSNDMLVNWRLLEMQFEENKKNLPAAFENKIETDLFTAKKLDEIKEINILVDNYTKIKNFNSQDIVENISQKLREEITQHMKISNVTLNLNNVNITDENKPNNEILNLQHESKGTKIDETNNRRNQETYLGKNEEGKKDIMNEKTSPKTRRDINTIKNDVVRIIKADKKRKSSKKR